MSRLKANTIYGASLDKRCERATVVAYRFRKGRVEFLLVSRNSDPDQFILPGGRVEAGETLSETARRECVEESGVKVRLLGPLVRYDHLTQRGLVKPTMAYLATGTKVIPSPEGRDVVWARYKDLAAGEYDVPHAVLDVLDYAAHCLRKHAAAA